MFTFLLALSALLTNNFVVSVAEKSADADAPLFVVNLDLPPENRWDSAVEGLVEMHGFEGSFGCIVDYITNLVPESVLTALEPVLENLAYHFAGEYANEIVGIWNKLDSMGYGDNITYGAIAAVNVLYEITVMCTSIVAQSDEGVIYHARNLDYGIPGLQNLTAQIEFQTKNKTAYRGTEFVGYVGLLTGMKPHAFSVSVNERSDFQGDRFESIVLGYLKNLASIATGGRSIGMYVRDVLANQDSFSDALADMTSQELVSPVYLTVAGVDRGEAAIITRNRRSPDESAQEGVWWIDYDGGAWWRLETNYDHWGSVPDDDNRRDSANAGVEAIGSATVDLEGLFGVLSTPPVLNNGTMYTATMSAGLDAYSTVVRNV